MDRGVDGWVDRWVDRQVRDGWMKVQIFICPWEA